MRNDYYYSSLGVSPSFLFYDREVKQLALLMLILWRMERNFLMFSILDIVTAAAVVVVLVDVDIFVVLVVFVVVFVLVDVDAAVVVVVAIAAIVVTVIVRKTHSHSHKPNMRWQDLLFHSVSVYFMVRLMVTFHS